MDASELIQELRTTMPGNMSNDLQESLVCTRLAMDSSTDTKYEFSTEDGQYYVTVTRGDVKVKFQFEVKFQLGKEVLWG